MDAHEIRRIRLSGQFITSPCGGGPEAVVERMGAVQAQEYRASKWAVGLRASNCTESDVENAFNSGKILRTHILRPTWHFVSAKDIRWITELTAPQIKRVISGYESMRGMDESTFSAAFRVLRDELSSGPQARDVLSKKLESAGISVKDGRMPMIMMRAELECMVCSGPRMGKQFSYSLTEQAAPSAESRGREDSIAELARRYFAARGPASVQDFAYWSHLPMKDAAAGAECLGGEFGRVRHGGREYMFHDGNADACQENATFLMPDYDEYLLSYRDRSSAVSHPCTEGKISVNAENDRKLLISDGIIAGKWEESKAGISLRIDCEADDAVLERIGKAKARYLGFILRPPRPRT
ncbi:MAG: winged helix DNA-binding domain-containing protein [Candidatus Methanoplasma sp.]|jgi:hypothetical protein|nr:winged helix DNA-binding domain-containing protein [Candidatus Methanoplasma sp.]